MHGRLNALQIEALHTLLMDRSDMKGMWLTETRREDELAVVFELKDKPAQVYILPADDYMPVRHA
jgi:hypothetical protein